MLSSAGAFEWAVFAAVVLATMGLDLALFGRGAHAMSFREATIRSVLWIVAGVSFSGWVYVRLGADAAMSYFVAYLVEESLSVDNLFVFLVVFAYFGVRELQQQRVLFWGIAGAVVMRGIFIAAGTLLLAKFHWMMYVFGLFLVFTGIKLAIEKSETVDPSQNLALRLARKYLRTTDKPQDNKFFVRLGGKLYATPLFLVLLVVEFTDVLFAVDSVPAVLAISTDPYVVYSSNIFAILGLRALYFMLAGMMSKFAYLARGLAAILVFIGVKMLFADVYPIPNLVSLGVIAGVLIVAVGISVLRPPPPRSRPPSIPEG